MGAKIPEAVAGFSHSRILDDLMMKKIHEGKVRKTYIVSEKLLLTIATDRLSIFDFVLPALVQRKGEVLTALTVFWLTKVLKGNTDHHLVSFGKNMTQYFPYGFRTERKEEMFELCRRAIVIEKFEMLPVECIARGYLTGSGLSTYKESGFVCGHKLPPGLHDGARLTESIFTPTTKAEAGHDEHISALSVVEKYGAFDWLTLEIYSRIAAFAAKREIILADTKFEFGWNTHGDPILCDEVATPDSSRFWDKREWEKASAEGKSPSGYDKEPVRQWGKTVETPFTNDDGKPITGIHKLEPTNSDHIAFVHGLTIPSEVLIATTERYLAIFKRLVGKSLEQFQEKDMGLK